MHVMEKISNILFLKTTFRNFSRSCRLRNMQAWQISEYGGTEKLHLASVPRMPIIRNPIDVLIKVHAASVNPLDVRMLEGYGVTAFNFIRKVNSCSLTAEQFPLVLGRDFSGTVVHVGKAVRSIKCGDEVWGATSPWQNGSHADYVLTSVCNISKKPLSINHVEAASFPYAALTAWSALTCFGGLSEKSCYGKRVLVTGASGGVGSFAVQLLKVWEAEVSATCSTDAVEMVLNLGADNVLDYEDPEFKNRLRSLKGLDLILDNVGKDYPAFTIDLLKSWKNSKYISLVSPTLKNADDSGLILGTIKSASQAAMDTIMSVKDGTSFRWAYFIPNGWALKRISEMVDKKQIMPVIEKIYSFNEIPQAYEKVLSGHARGKIVIDFLSEHTDSSTDVKEKV